MILFFLISCLVHKANLVGVVDYTDHRQCVIELENGEVVNITSNLCKSLREGDKIQFYVRRDNR